MQAPANGAAMPDDARWGGEPSDDDAPDAPRSHAERSRAYVQRTAAEAAVSRWTDRLVSVTRDWITEQPPPRVYLMRDGRTGRGAIPAHGVGVLGAQGGAGKSFATIQGAVSIATSTPWLGVMQPERAGRALIVSLEDPADEIRRRVYDVARACGVTEIPAGSIDVIDVHDVHAPLLTPDAQPTEHAHALIDAVRARGPYALVVLDPLARAAGANIDADNAAATALVSVLEAVSTAAQGFVLGAHHTSQTARRADIRDATALRGATALGDGARLVLLLTVEELSHDDEALSQHLGEIVTITRAKANHVRRWDPIQLRRGEHGVLVPLDTYDAERVAEARAGSTPAAVRAAAREGARDKRHAAVDEALRAVLADRPGIGTVALRAAMAARLGGCSVTALADAIARAEDDVRLETGPGRAVRHYLATEASCV